MSLQCCVPGCDNALGSSEAEKGSITFHSFPKNELPRLAWIKATCRLKITRVPHSSVVCSDHFKEDDFVVDTHKLMLKRGAIPSIFTPAQIQLMEERKEFLVPNITQQEKKKYSLPNSTQQKEKECSVPIITQQQVKDTGEGLDTSQCHQAQTDPMCKNTNRKVTDISLLCRICAKRSDRLIPIFEGEGLIVDLAVKMQQYLAMKVTKDDDLPVKVCVSCATAVTSWHDLVLMTIQAKKELNAILENDIGNNQRNFSNKGIMQQKGSVSNDGNLQNQEQDYFNSSVDQGMGDSGQLDSSLGAAGKTSTRIGLAGKDKIEDLQQYKLHYPWKYHEVAGTIFLRTKVLGFEPAAEAFMYTCCLCCEEMKDSDVIVHSKSHYPLKISDTCRLCHFSFASIHLLRNHIKRHLIIIDDEYVTKTPSLVTKTQSTVTKPSSSVTKNVDAQPNTTKLKIESRVVPAKPLQKSKPPHVCEYCGIEYRRKGLYVRHVRNQHLLPFKCRMCQKRFDSQTSIDNHECSAQVPWAEVDEITTESCNSDDLTCKCSKTFNTLEEYKEHSLTCDQDILCEECGLVFRTRREHRKHMATHSKIPVRKEGATWICEICGCKLGKHSARKHYMTHSFKEKKFTCDICKMNFLHRWSLVNHMQSHSDIRPFVCEICSKTFKRSDHLREHQLNKHQIGKSKPNDFKCDVCNRYFTSETYLIRHKRLHSTGMSYECQVCKGRFPTEHSLKMHQTRMKHDGGNLDAVHIISASASDRINKFRCKFCYQRYGSMASLKKHRLKHCSKSKMKVEVVEENEDEPTETRTEENSELEKTYECPKCNLRYLTDFGLKLHFARSKHSEVFSKYKKRPKKDPNEVKNPRFKCVQCDDIFSSLVSLRMHKIKRKHFSQCPHCGKRFAMEFKLKLHLVKVHQQKDVIVEESDLLTQEEKLPYQCATCSQLFAMKHNLESHITKKHSGNEEDPTSRPSRSSGRKKPKTEPIDDVFEEFTQEVSVIYHCTECWENFASEEDFNNHTHEANIILTEDLPENAIISEVIESES